MSVQRKDGRDFEIAIPEGLAESELAAYLADIFHESATEKHSSVTKLD